MNIISQVRTWLGHQGVQRYLANTSWLLGERVSRLLVGLFVSVYVIRYLGPARFGLLSYALSFVAFFASFAQLGLEDILVRELNRTPEHRDAILGTAFVMRIVAAMMAIAACVGAIYLTRSDVQTIVLVAIIAGGFVAQSLSCIQAHFYSEVRAKIPSLANMASFATVTCTRLVLIWSGAHLVWFAAACLIEQAARSIALAWLYQRHGLRLSRWRFDFARARGLLRDGWPIILGGLTVMIYMRIDQVMLKELVDAEAVGQYAAAVRISEAWYFVPTAIVQALYPAILNAKKTEERIYVDRLQKLYDLMVWLAVLVAVPTMFLSGSISLLLFGPAFSGTGTVLAIHTWSGLFVAVGVANSRWFLSENLMKISMINTAAGAVLNIALNAVLIPRYGINGVAVATLVSYGISAYVALALHATTWPSFLRITRSLTLISTFSRLRAFIARSAA
jgi:O-antigen/teichoic acid export membrane protein